jgi:hypothetical protein
MIRPSRVERLRYFMQRSASSAVSIVTNPNPLDSRVRGSTTSRHSVTLPSLEKRSSKSFSVTRVDRPVTYKLFPGLSASSLETVLSLLGGVRDRDRPRDAHFGDGESEYLLLRRGDSAMTMRCCRSEKLTKEFASIPIRVRLQQKLAIWETQRRKRTPAQRSECAAAASSRGKKTVTGCQPVTTRVQSPDARG